MGWDSEDLQALASVKRGKKRAENKGIYEKKCLASVKQQDPDRFSSPS